MNFSAIPNSALLGRILRQPLKLIPASTPMPILQGRLRGKRWIAGAQTHGCWLGSYEAEKRMLFESEVALGSTLYDIGANVGFYSLLASVLVGVEGRVYAFEPVPRNIHFLKEHLRLNKVENVVVIEAAVADKAGETYFDISPGSSMGHLASAGTLKVESVQIDELVAENRISPPDCLKIDVEGAEMLVLAGAENVLRAYRPKLFLATHGTEVHRKCCSFLSSLGYNLRSLSGNDIAGTDELFAV